MAIAVGAMAGALSLWVRLSGHFAFSDFDQMWIAGQAVLAGRDPYVSVGAQFAWPLFYPMPAVVVTLPLALLPLVWAQAAWTSVGFGLLAYALSARGLWPLLMLASYPALNALELGQWSPILTAAALMPALGWVAMGKPTSGLAVVGAYAKPLASRRWLFVNLCMCLLVIVISFWLCRPWLAEWRQALRSTRHFVPMVFRPGGVLLLASLARWRRPEARVIAFLCVVPLTTAAYETLALALIPKTRYEVILLSLLGIRSLCSWARRSREVDHRCNAIC